MLRHIIDNKQALFFIIGLKHEMLKLHFSGIYEMCILQLLNL